MRRRRRVSEPLTAAIAAAIWKMARETDLVQHEIAAALRLNQGRVSEVLSGKRYPEMRYT
ncbi:hypothetical protein ACRAWG_20150 [Methylobacterium sp. P31]